MVNHHHGFFQFSTFSKLFFSIFFATMSKRVDVLHARILLEEIADKDSRHKFFGCKNNYNIGGIGILFASKVVEESVRGDKSL